MKAGGGRNKGAAFERLICKMLREAWPDCEVRRGKQSHKADEPDVVVTAPTADDLRGRLWIECQHANAATPAKKWMQAERDMLAARPQGKNPHPVVIWRATGSRTISVTILVFIRNGAVAAGEGHPVLASIPLDDWIESWMWVSPDATSALVAGKTGGVHLSHVEVRHG